MGCEGNGIFFATRIMNYSHLFGKNLTLSIKFKIAIALVATPFLISKRITI